MTSHTKQLIALICGLLLFVYSVLALAEVGKGSPCGWQFPKWFGCVLDRQEGLAGGLIGAAVTLLAAWGAWSAVQQQIRADRARTSADRLEAERLLTEELTRLAEGMAAAWRMLVALPEEAARESTTEAREATAYMAERLSRPEKISNYRGMVDILGWERRMEYNAVILGLEALRPFADSDSIIDTDEVLNVVRHLADEFEICLPATGKYFEGLWRRSPKAMSFADYIEYVGRRRA